MVQEGALAPDFQLETQEGPVRLSDFRGSPVALYFYPKDNTSGCTAEACAFRDAMPSFEKVGAKVIGVSTDSLRSHAGFAAKFDLPFTLAADTDHKAAELYGVWVEKSMYGKKYMGIERSTFVIDATGTVRKVFRKVSVPGHAEEVASVVNELR
jgi:peroxiredoxin Q/BCP